MDALTSVLSMVNHKDLDLAGPTYHELLKLDSDTFRWWVLGERFRQTGRMIPGPTLTQTITLSIGVKMDDICPLCGETYTPPSTVYVCGNCGTHLARRWKK